MPRLARELYLKLCMEKTRVHCVGAAGHMSEDAHSPCLLFGNSFYGVQEKEEIDY